MSRGLGIFLEISNYFITIKTVCYVKVHSVTNKTIRKISVTNHEEGAKMAKERRAVVTNASVVLSFLICFIPLNVYLMLRNNAFDDMRYIQPDNLKIKAVGEGGGQNLRSIHLNIKNIGEIFRKNIS